MFGATSYYEQSRGLPAENGFQHTVLKLADTSTALREIGKVGSVIGIVSTAASTVFDYDPTLSLSITAISGLTWFCCHKIAQNLEPQAQSMLEHFRDLQRERNNSSEENRNVIRVSQEELQIMKTNASRVLSLMSLERRKENSAPHILQIKKTIENIVKDSDKVIILNKLIDALFTSNVKDVEIKDNKIEISLYEPTKKSVQLESTTLNIPKKIIFKVETNGTLVFDIEKFAPYEDRTSSALIKSNFAWWEIGIKEENFELITPHNFGLFTTFAGGTPVVRRINIQKFIDALAS